MPGTVSPQMKAKDAVNAVRAFVNDLFGPDGLRYALVEEIEFIEEKSEWHVTMSFTSATNIVLNPNLKELKAFRVDAKTGAVLSMRIMGN